MQVIFQDPYSALNPRMTALELVMEPLLKETKDAARAKAKRDTCDRWNQRRGHP